MNDAPVLIGIDAGTTHLKAAAFTRDGRLIAHAHAATPTRRLPDGGAEYDPLELLELIHGCLRDVRAQAPGPITGIGIASMAEAGVPTREDGTPAHPALAWFDPRPAAHAERITAELGRERIYRRTGLLLMPKHGLPKLLWLQQHHPNALRGTQWLSIAEFIARHLTGNAASAPTLAARTALYDLNARAWARDWLDAFHLPAELLPPLQPEGAPWGALTRDAAERTGLPEGTPVTVAGHDHPAAALGAGITGPGELLDSTGTAEAVIGIVPEPILTARAYHLQISQGPTPATTNAALQAGASAAGGSVEWLRREILGNPAHDELEQLVASAAERWTGLLFAPHLAGSGPPTVDPRARGAVAGLTLGTTRAQLARAVLEGTCLELRRMVNAMEDLAGHAFQRVTVTGGHARSRAWLQLKADVLGRPVDVPDVPEATLLGAALLGGVAGGEFTGADDAARAARPERRTVQPGEDRGAYDAAFDAYTSLVHALEPLRDAWP